MLSRCENQRRPRSLDLLAGILAGGTATFATYPLDVLQTRLQSSKFSLKKLTIRLPMFAFGQNHQTVRLNVGDSQSLATIRSSNLLTYTKTMIQDEGYSLFTRGFAANVAAISLSKGIYFTLYASCKNFLRRNRDDGYRESTVDALSATFAGFVSCTLTNPIWFLKTRLQLDSGKNDQNKLGLRMPIRIYKSEGLRVFYRGLTASYLGISETVLYFTIYEYLRRIFIERRQSKQLKSSCKGRFYVSDCVIASTVSKTIATVIAYPHEVFRTRTREHENIEKSLSEVIRTIWKNNGWQGFYVGLGTHLIRQVPNTAIVFLIYEAIVHFGMEVRKVKT